MDRTWDPDSASYSTWGDFLTDIVNINALKIGLEGYAIVDDIRDGDYGEALWDSLGLACGVFGGEVFSAVCNPLMLIAEKSYDNFTDPLMDTERKICETLGEATLIVGTATLAVFAASLLLPAAATTGAVIAVGGAIAAGVHIFGNLADYFVGSGKGDWVETVSDNVIDTVSEGINNIGNAVKSGWNTVCSWFS